MGPAKDLASCLRNGHAHELAGEPAGAACTAALAADSGVLHVLLEGIRQASLDKPPPNMSHQFPHAVHHDKEHQAAASSLHGLLALPYASCSLRGE